MLSSESWIRFPAISNVRFIFDTFTHDACQPGNHGLPEVVIIGSKVLLKIVNLGPVPTHYLDLPNHPVLPSREERVIKLLTYHL